MEHPLEPPFESYEQALQFLYGRINHERLHSDAYTSQDFKLDRMRWLLNLLHNPQERLPTVHVAGTKGKGSVCAMVASILAAAGYRTGLYISPHISAFEERMTVNGQQPSREQLIDLVNRLRGPVSEMDHLPQRMPPTYFEIATAMAWQYFLDQQAEIAVLETGLGGRLDSTNVCRPMATCITNISRDHTHLLGHTEALIAAEKGGIIKAGIPVVTGVQQPEAFAVVERIANEHHALLWRLGREIQLTHIERKSCGGEFHAEISVRTPLSQWNNIRVPLRGRHQADNTALVLGLIDSVRASGWAVSDDAVHHGLVQVHWPARVEVVGREPTVIIDAAHNWASAKALVTTLRDEFPQQRRILVFASTQDKDVRGQLRLLLPQFDTVILTRYVDNPRAISPEELRGIVAGLSNQPVHLTEEPVSAWKLARHLADPADLIVVTGSFFLVAELRELILAEFGQQSAASHDKLKEMA